MSGPSATRNDERFGEDLCVSFAMYCDENGLSREDGEQLAERVANELQATAEGRDYADE